MRKLVAIAVLGLAACGGSDESLPKQVAPPEYAAWEVTVTYLFSDESALPIQPAQTAYDALLSIHADDEHPWLTLGSDWADTGYLRGTKFVARQLAWKFVRGDPSSTATFTELKLRFLDVDGDGAADEVEGEGLGSLRSVFGDRVTFTDFTAKVTGRIDRTPPSIEPAPATSLTPFSTLTFPVSEEIRAGDVTVTADGAPVEIATPYWSTTHENGVVAQSLVIEPADPLPWGSTVEVVAENLRDLTGNQAQPFHWIGRVSERPADPPSPSFANGLSGYVAEGVQIVDAAALPLDDQGVGLIGFAGQPWSLLFEIDVPDTEDPQLAIDFWTLPGDVEELYVWLDVWSESSRVQWGSGWAPTSQPLSSPVHLAYGSGDTAVEGDVDSISERHTVWTSLAKMRGERAVIRVWGGDASMPGSGVAHGPLDALLLDNLRVVP